MASACPKIALKADSFASMTNADKKVLYLLSRCEGIGPMALNQLLEHLECFHDLLEMSSEQVQHKLGRSMAKLAPFFSLKWRAQRLAEFDRLATQNIRVLFKGDNGYPPLLASLKDAPFVLYTSGKPISFDRRFLSIVGTRTMTAYGKRVVEQLLAGLDPNQVSIVSGLAKGVDAHAQSTAFEMGFEVLSVVAHGLDRTYPVDHRALRQRIEQQGGTVSEFFNGVQPLAGHFIARNRIIAGLSEATLIIESAQSGGSLTTAHFAHGYERMLFAVPGRLTDNFSSGCNRLIADLKALPYSGPETLIDALSLQQSAANKGRTRVPKFKTPGDEKLYNHLVKHGRVYPSQLLRELKLEKQVIYNALLNLTLEGAIVHHKDNSYEVI